MYSNTSNKVPYVIGISAIGGAIGFLFLTRSGQRVRDQLFNTEAACDIPGKVDDARLFLEHRGKEIGSYLREFVNRVKDSAEIGKQAYRETEETYNRHISRIHGQNREVVANIHRAIDELDTTVQNLEQSILQPLYEMGGMVRGVERGVRHFLEAWSENTHSEEHTPFYSDPHLVSH